MTGGRLEVAYGFIGIAAAAVLLIVCGLLISKAFNAYRERQRKECERKYQPYFERLEAGFDQPGPLPKPAGALPDGMDRRVIQARLTAWIDRLDGAAREKLIELCEELGFVERELARLGSRRSLVRTAAAYQLGLMRSKRAAAPLLGELRKQRFGPALFVYARSFALCARNTDDLEQMVMQIVKHRKPVDAMVAAILEEAGGDLEELAERLERCGNPDALRIARHHLRRQAEEAKAASGNGNVLAFREPPVRDGARKGARATGSDGRVAK